MSAGPATSSSMMQPKRYTYYGTGRTSTTVESSPMYTQQQQQQQHAYHNGSQHSYSQSQAQYSTGQYTHQPSQTPPSNPYSSKRHSVHVMAGGGNSGNTANSNNSNSSSGARPHRRQAVFGPYILGRTIGEGEFGKVKLAWSINKKASDSNYYNISSNMGSNKLQSTDSSLNSDDIPKQVAIKLIKMETIPKGSERETKIFREINALRLLTHPNIVQLEEVLQNKTHIGIVLEYASGGEFYKFIQERKRLKEHQSCGLFAQLISGVHYMHSKGLVHRDLKLENLLLDKFENLIITDFGFVNEFDPGRNELMKTSCGSPCYAAPELVVSSRPYLARRADIWSCGIILFAMLAGYLPWDDDPTNPEGDDIAKLYMYITQTPLKFPEYIAPVPRDLLRRILVPNPKNRLSIKQIEQHQWLQGQKSFLSITPEEWDKILSQNKVYRPAQSNQKKPVRPHSGCSTSSNGEKRKSLVLDNSYNVQPLPPQESQIFATIQDTPSGNSKSGVGYKSNTGSNIHNHSNSNNTDSSVELYGPSVDNTKAHERDAAEQENNADSKYAKEERPTSHTRHRRTNSAASAVLQAVYDASEPQSSNYHQSPYTNHSTHLQTSTDSTDLSNGYNTSGVMSSSAMGGKGKFQQSSKPRKPRPMSYQPTMSQPASDTQGSFNYPPHRPFQDHDRENERNAMKENAMREKEILERKLKAMKLKDTEEHNEPVNHTVPSNSTASYDYKRASRIYSSSKKDTSIIQEEEEEEEGAEDTLESQNQRILPDLTSSSASAAATAAATAAAAAALSPGTKKRIVSDASSISSPMPFNARNMSGASASETIHSKSTSNASRRVSYNQYNGTNTAPSYSQPSYQQQQRQASSTSIPANVPTPSEAKHTPAKEKQDKKSKRFSLLSFYSLYDNSRSSIDIEREKQPEQEELTAQNSNTQSRRVNSRNSAYMTSDSRRMSGLYSSSATPTSTANVPVSTPVKNKGQTNSPFTPSSTVSTPSSKTGTADKNPPSTAKKVIDFFKRRSMR